MKERNIGWKAFRDSNPDGSCLRRMLAPNSREVPTLPVSVPLFSHVIDESPMSAAYQVSPQDNGRHRPRGLAPEELNCSGCRFAPTGLSEENRGALRALMPQFSQQLL
jgi:hypothetical protein